MESIKQLKLLLHVRIIYNHIVYKVATCVVKQFLLCIWFNFSMTDKFQHSICSHTSYITLLPLHTQLAYIIFTS